MAADTKKLREQAARTLTEARSMLDSLPDDATPERREEVERQVDCALDELSQIERQIEIQQRLAEADRRIAELAEAEERSRREARRPGVEPAEVRQGEDVPYREAFHAYLREAGNVAAIPAEHRAVLKRGYAKIEKRAQTSSTNTAGGYTVPTEMLNILVQAMAAWGPMYDGGVVTELVTDGGGTLQIPTVDDTAVTAGASAGQGVTLGDTGAKDVTFGQKLLEAYSFDTQWIRVSRELADDSIFAMETVIGDLLGQRLGRLANQELTVGTGSGAPNGIVTASSLGKTAASATAITSDEIMDLLHSVDPAYRQSPKAAFMFNDSTLAAIRKLKDGQGNYLWQMGNVQAGQPGTLLGYRYYVNQAMDSIATAKKAIVFGDFGKYFVRKVGQPLIGAISDKDFWPGFGIAGYIRFDGELADTKAVKHLILA